MSPLHVFRNEADGIEARVWPANAKGLYSVTLFDTDAEETLPVSFQYPVLERAIDVAKKAAEGRP